MKNVALYLPLILLLEIFSCANEEESTIISNSVEDPTFSIHRGTNIAHWLSQSRRRGAERETFFTEKDIDYIKSAGFDFIRLPIDEVQMWDSTGNREAAAFQLLDNCMTWVSEKELKIILDLHIIRSHYFNSKENTLWTDPKEQDKLIALWKDLSSFLNKWPNSMLAYEFMNEPVAPDAQQWNELIVRMTDSIRSWEPNRTLVIGSNRWQSANTFDQLSVPSGDEHILLSFHFYEPFHLTHYKASWTHLKDFEGEVQYPGQIVVNGSGPEEQQIYNRDTLEYMMRKAFRLADSMNLPLFCGEFGVIDGTPEASKLAWYEDMVAILEKHNVAYANWNYKSGSFSFVDENLNPNVRLEDILTGK